MRNKSRLFLLSSLTYAFAVLLFIANGQAQLVKADTTHVVISQIQLSGATASDEFVELFNPTNSPIDLAKWRLTRKTSTGSSSQNLVASLSGTIAPRSYFLIAHPTAVASSMADYVYSSSSSGMTTNNTVTLFSDAGVTPVDKVGMGTATDIESTAFADNPEGGESIVRKATTNSTSQSLFTGGAEATFGNGLDTDNNSTDFVLFPTSLPRNSSTTATQPTNVPSTTNTPTPIQSGPTPTQSEPTPTQSGPTPLPSAITPSPSVTPSSTPTPTQPVPTVPQPTATPAPTIVPTNIPTPTKTPTPTPTAIPTATPTSVPTVAPTNTPTTLPTPTMTPRPSATPTTMPTPTVTPTPILSGPTPIPGSGVIIDKPFYANRRLVCTQTFRVIKILNTQFYIPKISCSIVRS